MSYVPLNRAEHAGRMWRRVPDHSFARSEAIVPVAAIEVGDAAASLPLGFSLLDGALNLVAILSPRSGENWFVGHDGRWLGTYVPALFRAFPFRLGRAATRDELVLCAADGQAAGPGSEPVYEPSGAFSPRVKSLASFLITFEKSRRQTEKAASALQEAGVLAPWPLRLRDHAGAEIVIEGMLRTDEAALSELDDQRFLELRRCGALGIAYAQLLSIQRIDMLEKLARIVSFLKSETRGSSPASAFLCQSDDNLVF